MLKFETESFARKIFEKCNENQTEEFIDWENLLLAVKAIQSKNIDHKIDLFFKVSLIISLFIFLDY